MSLYTNCNVIYKFKFRDIIYLIIEELSGVLMKIIVCGDGKVGQTISYQLLKEGHDVVIVDKNAKLINHTTNTMDCLCIQGNAASREVLIEAGAKEADLLIAVTSTDEVNLLCCLIAKKLGVGHTIARVRNPEYSNEIQHIQSDLGLSMSVNPESQTATEIARLLRFPSAIKNDSFAKGRVDLVEFKIKPNSILIGTALKDLRRVSGVKVLVCAVLRKGKAIIPDGNFVFEEGDKVSITARPADILLFFMTIGVPCRKIKNVMITGGGKIAYYLSKILIDLNYNVKIIEMNEEKAKELAFKLPKATVINADATNHAVLLEEGLENTDAMITLTGIDEENVFLALYANKAGVKKSIAKVNRIDIEELLSDVGIDSIVAPKKVVSNEITRYVRAMQNSIGSNVEALTKIINDEVEALEFRVVSTFKKTNIPLKDLHIKSQVLLACIVRNNKVIFPDGNEVILPKDNIVVVTTRTGFNDLNDILED